MSGTAIRMTAQKNHTLDQIFLHLQGSSDLEFVARRSIPVGDSQAIMAVFEMYFIRTGSYASVSVLLAEDDSQQTAQIISCGGGEGITNVSYGANRKLARITVEALQELGFSVDAANSDPLPEGFFRKIFKKRSE